MGRPVRWSSTPLVFRALAGAVLMIIGVHASALAATTGPLWIGAWGADPSETTGTLHLPGYTLRQIVLFGGSGTQIRLRLSNAMGDFGITLGPVHVATPAGGASRIVASSDTPVTVGGQTTFYIPAGASVVTDPLPWPAVAGSSIDVSIYIAADTISLTAHQFAMATGFYASGNQVGLATLTSPVQTSSRIILSGVDVLGGSTSGTIATLGDSITDGFRSTYDKNHRWPDYLVVRLQKTAIVNALGVVNAGITGNALLSNQIGINAAARLPNDVLALPNLRYLCVLEGANDIASANASSASVIAAYQQIIDKAHELGVKVIFGTITPFYNAGISNPGAKEAVREAVNAWIRAGVGFDGFIDFDAAIRDPKNPLIINPIYDSGDHAHPNDAGYAAMAQAVNLALFGATSNAASALDVKPPSRVRKQ